MYASSAPGQIVVEWDPLPGDHAQALYRWPALCPTCRQDRPRGDLKGLYQAGMPGRYEDTDVVPDLSYRYEVWLVYGAHDHLPTMRPPLYVVGR